MKTQQYTWSESRDWQPERPTNKVISPDLVLIFGAAEHLKTETCYAEIREIFPQAILFGCSTAGEISGVQVSDHSIAVTAIKFDSSHIQLARLDMKDARDSFDAGLSLARRIEHTGLRHVLVLSDGLKVNGSQLVDGLREGLPRKVSTTGGLSGDGPKFSETYVIGNSAPESNVVSILGFYGEKLKIGYASLGGWDPFGPERLITRSEGNVLYEMEGKSALELYKTYLGDHANGLPATGLLFPLKLRVEEEDIGVVRTVLSVDEKKKSMTFAGDLPEGAYVRLMKANFDRLIDGAVGAAKVTLDGVNDMEPDLALLISCVGRKMVLKQRVEEEVEGVRDVLGEKTVLTGFYSYGEISPFTPGAKCELHNQTMTITAFKEE